MSRGRVLFVRSSTTSSSRRQCDGGGRSGLFSDSDSFYQLCQLSALPASILGLSEQTRTGATRGRGRQSQGPCSYYWRRRIQYTSRLVFAFFDSITEGRRSPSLSATSKHTWITQAYVMDAFFWSFLVFVAFFGVF